MTRYFLAAAAMLLGTCFQPAHAADPECEALDWDAPRATESTARGGIIAFCTPANDQSMRAEFRRADGSVLVAMPGLEPLTRHAAVIPADTPDQALTVLLVEEGSGSEGDALVATFRVPPAAPVLLP